MGVDVQSHIFLTSTLVGGEWSISRPGRFTPGVRAPGTHWIGGWVDLTADLDDLEKRKFLTLPELELRPLSRPARSYSLYRLHHPGSSPTLYGMYLNNGPQTNSVYADDTCVRDRSKDGFENQRGLSSMVTWWQRWNFKIN
jgi:hypothetical protein